MKIHTFRLKTGQDLKSEIISYAQRNSIQAGFIITCVGSLSQANIRLAGANSIKQDIKLYVGHFEITSLVGTLSVNGSHLHIAISDNLGQTFGGHLKEGSLVHTTAEIVIGEDESSVYIRQDDKHTGFKELEVNRLNKTA